MIDFAQRRTQMVDSQVRPNEVTSYPVIESMLNIAREEFVPDALRDVAYSGENLALGFNRTMLEPRTIGRMLEALNLQNSDFVLTIAGGYGYGAACIARICEAVVAVESTPQLAEEAQSRLTAQAIYNVAVVHGDIAKGWPGQAPYDAILIDGGAIEVVPDALCDQLREGGRIVALFREGNLGTARLGLKQDGRVSWKFAFNAFAPALPDFRKTEGFAL